MELLLAKSDIDIHKPSNNGSTVLLAAVSGNHLEILRVLLSRSEMDVNGLAHLQIGNRRVPLAALLIACDLGYVEIVQLLLSKSEIDINYAIVDVNGSRNGDSALSCAAFKGHIKVVRLLLAQPKILVTAAAISKAKESLATQESVKDLIKRRKLISLLENHKK